MNNDPFVLHGKKCDIINTWLLYCYYTEAMQPKQIIEILSREYWFCIEFFYFYPLSQMHEPEENHFQFNLHVFVYRAFHNK